MIKFGPSGNSDSFYKEGYDHTEQAAKYVKERGLDCFEYSFGRGVRMSEEKAFCRTDDLAIGYAWCFTPPRKAKLRAKRRLRLRKSG